MEEEVVLDQEVAQDAIHSEDVIEDKKAKKKEKATRKQPKNQEKKVEETKASDLENVESLQEREASLSEDKENKKEISGGSKNTTNNIMEITAVLEALKCLKVKSDVQVYSDSAYVVNAFLQDWITTWEKRNWRNSEGKVVKNLELWQRLIELNAYHKIKWNKVKGHSDDELNNRCDQLAKDEIIKHLSD